MNACTIIAKNYAAQARVLATSFLREHPEGRFWTLVIDDHRGWMDPADERFELLSPSDIGCEVFQAMAGRYGVLELSTAVKPWLLRHLLALTGEPVTYLDPDIEVLSSLELLDRLAARHAAVVTPHNDQPIPHDGLRPTQADIMVAGAFNLGYVTLAPTAEVHRALDWWGARLERECLVDPARGYFVDQRWFDLVPGFLPTLAIVRSPAYNTAYWNLFSRRLEFDGERYIVNGEPLAFFHFSGFDPERPDELSRHQTRVAMTGALRRICQGYAESTRAAGFAEARRWPYSYATLPGGMPFDEALRSLFRRYEREEIDVPSPFTAPGASQLLGWALAPPPGVAQPVSRLLLEVHSRREDLRRAFPDPTGADAGPFLAWARDSGAVEIPVLAALAARAPRGRPPLRSSRFGAAVRRGRALARIA